MVDIKILDEKSASRVEYRTAIEMITHDEMSGCSVHVRGQRPHMQVMDLLDTRDRRCS